MEQLDNHHGNYRAPANPTPRPPQLEGVGAAEATELGTNPIQLPACIPGGSCSSLAAPKDNGDAIPEQGSEGQLASQEHRGLLKQDSSLRPGPNSKTPYPAETQASPCLTPSPAHTAANVKSFSLAVSIIWGHVYNGNKSQQVLPIEQISPGPAPDACHCPSSAWLLGAYSYQGHQPYTQLRLPHMNDQWQMGQSPEFTARCVGESLPHAPICSVDTDMRILLALSLDLSLEVQLDEGQGSV